MSPVVLVHGIRSNASAFDQFEPVLSAVGMPTARVNLGENTIERGANRLKSQILAVAAEFGSKHVHIVTHSKGGLWTRWMMRNLTEVGVYSVTTLDTPHEGSVLADLVVASEREIDVYSPVNRLIRLVVSLLPLDSVPDLTVPTMRIRNPSMPLITRMAVGGRANDVEYFAHAADGNTNSNTDSSGFGIIEPAERTFLGNFLDSDLYRFVQEYREATVVGQSPSGQPILGFPLIPNSPPYPLNDFVVTTGSSWCTNTAPCRGMRLEKDGGVPWKKSHESIHDAEVANYVRQLLGVMLERRLDLDNQ